MPSIARVLGRAFYDDPLFIWLFPDDSRRMAQATRACALLAGFAYVPGGHATVAVSEDVVRGAALWASPGSAPEGLAAGMRALPHWLQLLGPAKLLRFARYMNRLTAATPSEPHWYLTYLAADPATPHRGLGGRLIRWGIAQAEADGVPLYLETMNPHNIGYYERFDFHVVNTVTAPGTPTSYGLMRSPMH